MLSANEAELGLVQIDLLHKLKDSDANVATLKAVMPLHANLLHVITLAEGSLVDFWTWPWTESGCPSPAARWCSASTPNCAAGRVALVGSAQLTAQMLEEHRSFELRFVSADSDEQALAMLRKGEVQAIFSLGRLADAGAGTPDRGTDLKLADFDVVPRAPYKTVKRNYQNLGVLNLTMLAVPNLLVARPFNAAGRQGQRVSALQSCLLQQLDELKDGRYQAAWKEIGDPADTQGWRLGRRVLAIRASTHRSEPARSRECAEPLPQAQAMNPTEPMPTPTPSASRAARGCGGPWGCCWPRAASVPWVNSRRIARRCTRPMRCAARWRSTRWACAAAATRFDYLPFAVATHQDVQAALARPA